MALQSERAFTGHMTCTKSDLHNLYTKDTVYMPRETASQLQDVKNTIDHIQLDNTFLSECDKWRQNFSERQIHQHKQGAANNVAHVREYVGAYRSSLPTSTIAGLQDNQLREAHHVLNRGLNDVTDGLRPYGQASHDRVQQFCDWIGVTDRFTGYRHNLNKSHEPLQYNMQWLKSADGRSPLVYPKYTSEMSQPHQTGRFNLRAKTAPPTLRLASGGAVRDGNSIAAAVATAQQMTPQQSAGINTAFPGRSEYIDRYTRPQTSALSCNFTINPTPDFSVVGKPAFYDRSKVGPTEYVDRYTIPDPRNVHPMPWRSTMRV